MPDLYLNAWRGLPIDKSGDEDEGGDDGPHCSLTLSTTFDVPAERNLQGTSWLGFIIFN